MTPFDPALLTHLSTGATHVCHAWSLERGDGVVMGFTDHDRDLEFDGIQFKSDSGLSAVALAQSTGLSVDNSEAMGALSGDMISEADIEAGRYDGAQVTAWQVQWDDVAARQIMFRGLIGDIRRAGGAFQAELRGLAEVLNQPKGRVYGRGCGAELGDGACGIDLGLPQYRGECVVLSHDGAGVIEVSPSPTHAEGLFAHGRLMVLDGAGQGLSGVIKSDQIVDGARRITLWHSPRVSLAAGDGVALIAGCDKRFETCRQVFLNQLNFQGFPDIPGEDWMSVFPRQSGEVSGGSRR